MPFKESNYANSLIYKLCCKDPNIEEIYVGSSTNFKQRKASHKKNCYNENSRKYKMKVYQFIRDNGGWDNWNMIQIEPYSCETKRELEKREEELRKELKASLNMASCYGFDKQRNKETQKKYRELHKEDIKDHRKKYYEENKEAIKDKVRKYHQDNREKILEENKEKITCECGSIFRKKEKARHQRSNKHQSFILENN